MNSFRVINQAKKSSLLVIILLICFLTPVFAKEVGSGRLEDKAEIEEPVVRKVSIKQVGNTQLDDKGRNLKENQEDICTLVQERMNTYEALSEMRSNTLPELLVIDRFIDALPERCGHIYGKIKLVDFSRWHRKA